MTWGRGRGGVLKNLVSSTSIAMLLLLLLAVAVNGQMVPQCSCAEFEPCYGQVTGVIEKCADRCQSHFTAVGANYPQARACIMKKIGGLQSTLTCAKNNMGAVCGSGTVPKRYTETIQLAAFREITGILSRSGIANEAGAFLQIARKAIGCIVKCVQSQGCVAKFGKTCGLALPSDNQIVSTFKTCAMQAGVLSTAGLRETCSCLGASGISQLTPLCPRITVT